MYVRHKGDYTSLSPMSLSTKTELTFINTTNLYSSDLTMGILPVGLSHNTSFIESISPYNPTPSLNGQKLSVKVTEKT